MLTVRCWSRSAFLFPLQSWRGLTPYISPTTQLLLLRHSYYVNLSGAHQSELRDVEVVAGRKRRTGASGEVSGPLHRR
ncbi:hypothetical protein chiPu_0003437 [Chiloscyllium punctatum]|uniref:Uncharacterized protein n=1 Tax=Chiloscyllium punctatum TaxID=137246 RepID=A0A401S3P0_CHIPU|nr:hypothetical protein [Chiloscyllium punctatum]